MQNPFPMLDLYRAQMRATAQLLTQQADAVRDLAEARGIEDVLALQARLASTQLERAMELWTGMLGQVQDQPGAIVTVPDSAAVPDRLKRKTA